MAVDPGEGSRKVSSTSTLSETVQHTRMATFTCWEIVGELFQADSSLLDVDRAIHAGLDGTRHIDDLSEPYRLARGSLADAQAAVQQLQLHLEGLVAAVTGQTEPTGVAVALPCDVGHRVAVAGSLVRPLPVLTEVQRKELTDHLLTLERTNPEKFDVASRDPDQGGKQTRNAMDEARIALDLRDRGFFAPDFTRPTEPDQGDFCGPDDRQWDVKGIHTDWPPCVSGRARRGRQFSNGYTEHKFRKTVERQFAKGRSVIIDTRNANQEAIDDMLRIVDEEGWGGRIIWYP